MPQGYSEGHFPFTAPIHHTHDAPTPDNLFLPVDDMHDHHLPRKTYAFCDKIPSGPYDL